MVHSLYDVFVFGENVLALWGVLIIEFSVLEGICSIKDKIWQR